MSIMEKMMDFMMGRMSKEEKEEMMPKMMMGRGEGWGGMSDKENKDFVTKIGQL